MNYMFVIVCKAKDLIKKLEAITFGDGSITYK